METNTTTPNTPPDFGHAPVAAAEAPLHDFGDPKMRGAEAEVEHEAFRDHDFGSAEDRRG